MYLKREIYEVHLAYVNGDGYHASDPEVNGHKYPITVDSASSANNNDVDLALRKAKGFLGDAEKYLSNQTSHQIDYGYIIRVSDGVQIEKRLFGKLNDIYIPDPEPEPEEEEEPEAEPTEGGEGE